MTASRRASAQRPNPRREGALRAAVEVIAERGVDQTRYRDVADASGIPVATLQYMFGSLEGLVLETLAWAANRYRSQSRAIVEAIDSPQKQIEAFVDRSVGTDQVDRGRWRLWLEFWYTATRDPRFAERVSLNSREYHDMLVSILARGRDRGAFRSDLEPEGTAIQVYGVIDGIGVNLILRTETPDYPLVRRLMLDAIDRILRPAG